MLAAMAAGRNSIGYELSDGFSMAVENRTTDIITVAKARIADRLTDHMAFVENRLSEGKTFRYTNTPYGFPVITNQEKNLLINEPEILKKTGPETYEVTYSDVAPRSVIALWEKIESDSPIAKKPVDKITGRTRTGKTNPVGRKKQGRPKPENQ
jgi:hypothetical protein